jgi:hypothetical protein
MQQQQQRLTLSCPQPLLVLAPELEEVESEVLKTFLGGCCVMRFVFFSKDSAVAQKRFEGLDFLGELSSLNCSKESSGVSTFCLPLVGDAVVVDHLFF